MRGDATGFHVHICLYSLTQNAPPFQDIGGLFSRSEQDFDPSLHHSKAYKDGPRSLYEIARKVDRPLDARLTRISIDWLDRQDRQNTLRSSRSPSRKTRHVSMSPESSNRKRNGHPSPAPSRGRDLVQQTDALTLSQPSSPNAAIKAHSSTAPSTPIARFIKENSFRIDDEDAAQKSNNNSSANIRSGSLEVSFGIVHLFRDDAALNDVANAKTRTTLEDDSGCILAVLGVPSHIGPADFLQLIEPAADAISQVRMIREELAGRCMVLLKFRSSDSAEEFHKMYSDQPFDPADDPDELCRVVYVTKVTVSTTSTLPYAYPLLANSDPWPITQNDHALSRVTASNELPTCPVCLERMDSSVTGLMTVTCQHTFHCSCLSKWSDSRCPVCRYTQSRLSKKGHVIPSFVPEHGCCAVCGTGGDLWVCLICATVGCGRYKAGHAHRHFQETGHLYSLELETQRVWDYAGDGYVHRLIQSKAEFKSAIDEGPTPIAYRADGGASATPKESSKGSFPLEASSSTAGRAGAAGGAGAGGSATEMEDKMEALGMEYSHLLSTQLESQRAFYEDQVRVHQQKHEQTEAGSRNTLLELEACQKEREALRLRLESMTSRHDNLHANLDVALKRMKKADEDLRGERLMSQGLVSRIDKLTADGEARAQQMAALQAENADLREQVRDLMFFVEARAKVTNEGGEALREGGIQVPEEVRTSATATSSSKNKKKKKVIRKPPGAAGSGQSTIPSESQHSTTQIEESTSEVNEQPEVAVDDTSASS